MDRGSTGHGPQHRTWPGRDAPPAPSDARWRLRVLGALWFSGGIIGLLALLPPAGPDVQVGLLLATGCGAVTVGATLLLVARRATVTTSRPPRSLHVLLGLGTLTVGWCVLLAGSGSSPIAYSALFVYIGLFAGAFFAPLHACGHLAFAMVSFGGALASVDQPVTADLILVSGVTITVAVMCRWSAIQGSLAVIDPLTGAANRRGLDRVLEAATDRHPDDRAPLALALIDLDHFKRFNDQRGHVAGDELLTETARRWQEQLPADATLARLGGDEFVVVLPGAGRDAAAQLIDALRGSLPDQQTCSAGLTSWAPGDTASLLLARADAALYEAKRSGRSRTRALSDDSDVALELWRALEAGEFRVHYQPITTLVDDRVRSVEALLRWEHPDDGLRPPAEFIPAAERSGAIHALGRWVLDEACHYGARLRDQLGPDAPTVAVNVSVVQLGDPRLLTDVQHALATSGLPASSLVLELTENALEGGLEGSTGTLWALRALGVRLAMDDFGTGHSSLNRLRDLPFDVLKIDRAFVADLTDDDRQGALLSAIISMAASLGLETVAEGIETPEQLTFLREHGCVRGQGFLLGRPAPSVDLAPTEAPPA